MGQCSLPLEYSDQPLVFQMTRVNSSFEGLAWRAVAWHRRRPIGLHLTAQDHADLTRAATLPSSQRRTPHMDLQSEATWSVLEHSLEVDVY